MDMRAPSSKKESSKSCVLGLGAGSLCMRADTGGLLLELDGIVVGVAAVANWLLGVFTLMLSSGRLLELFWGSSGGDENMAV